MSALTDKEFEYFFKKYFVSLTVYCTKFVKDTEIGKDIAHKCFMKIWEKRSTLQTESNIPGLLYKIGYNLSMNYIRDTKKFTTDETLPLMESENSEADKDIQAAELEAAVVETIKAMPEKSRKVFLMSRYDNLSNNSIAEKLGISIKTVEAHITTALKMLRKKIYGSEKILIGFLLGCVLYC
ncbi:MAG: RNA polymerase sigma-70 factor [Bacteroidales bacterium]|nr:RNA polymerase sigma-70 factor [Bacteroidales bacterium]